MDKRKKKDLESKGYKVGTVQEFLELSTDESEYIELKLALSDALAKLRKKSKLTQAQLAKMLKSSQSRQGLLKWKREIRPCQWICL